ncbi:FAS1-like dehydratase domain-containing protein [Patulibacter sp. S7RM1-6]
MIDPEIVGADIGTVRFPLERSKLAELARAFDDRDPVWHDPGAARTAGLDGIPVPPTATVLADHWRPGGATGAIEALGADLSRLLHGEAAWELLRPLRAGDELVARQQVEGVEARKGRRGGSMTLVRLTTEYADAAGQIVARRRDTLIEREA